MTQLSININKFALIRNARETDNPNLIDISNKCIEYGANGITVHPRPDQRHIKFSDLAPLFENIKNNNENIEFNVEGYPSNKFCEIVNEIKPDQVTLVPDPPEALTSSFGWNCFDKKEFLKNVTKNFKSNNIRVSLFINPEIEFLENLIEIDADRVELYTFDYAKNYSKDPEKSIKPYIEVVKYINSISNIGINAGHDLNLVNLDFLLKNISNIQEVSIGHALICDTFEFGLENTVKQYAEITKKYIQ